MGREIDEAFIDEAVERYLRIDARLTEFAQASARIDVTVHSPDGLVEVIVTVAGVIRDVVIDERLLAESGADVSRSVRLAVTAASEAAQWARAKLHGETFADYYQVGESLMELDDLVLRVEGVRQLLDVTAGQVRHLSPGVWAFGGDGPGQLGALGRALSGQCDEAIEARGQEAVRYGTAMADLAEALRHTAGGYRDLESRREGGVS